jgi:hypothetical protein
MAADPLSDPSSHRPPAEEGARDAHRHGALRAPAMDVPARGDGFVRQGLWPPTPARPPSDQEAPGHRPRRKPAAAASTRGQVGRRPCGRAQDGRQAPRPPDRHGVCPAADPVPVRLWARDGRHAGDARARGSRYRRGCRAMRGLRLPLLAGVRPPPAPRHRARRRCRRGRGPRCRRGSAGGGRVSAARRLMPLRVAASRRIVGRRSASAWTIGRGRRGRTPAMCRQVHEIGSFLFSSAD